MGMNDRGVVFRRVGRKLTYRRRGMEALSGNEQVYLKKLKKMIIFGLIKEEQSVEILTKANWKRFHGVCIAKYLRIKISNYDKLKPDCRRNRLFDSFEDFQFDIFFRFTKEELRRVQKLMELPEMFKFANGATMCGEEVFLRGMYELVSGERQGSISINVFGGGQALQSFAYNSFIDHVFLTHKHLVRNNIKWFYDNGLLHESAEAIGRKMKECDEYEYPKDWVNNVCMFIDCNCLATRCPGGGPAEEGEHAARWSDKVQQSFYNGWKSVHGLKHQTCDIAHGITVDISKAHSLRRNDLYLLRDSKVNEQLQRLTDLYIFGDSAYKVHSNISSYVPAAAVEAAGFEKWNYAMKSVRIAIEWNYGYTANLFRYAQTTDKLRILGSKSVSRMYTVVTLLRNMRVMMRGGQSSVYFGLRMHKDLVEHYVHQTALNSEIGAL